MIISKKKHEELLAVEIKKSQEMSYFIEHLYKITLEWRERKIGNYRAISEIHQLLSRLLIERGQEGGRIPEVSEK